MDDIECLREQLYRFIETHRKGESGYSPEVQLDNEDSKILEQWFNYHASRDPACLRGTLLAEYQQSCDQMRHWDNIQWVLNGLFLGIGLAMIGYSFRTDIPPALERALVFGFGVGFLWLWFLPVYCGFRRRALRTLTLILLLEDLLSLKSQTYPLRGTWYTTAHLHGAVRLNLFVGMRIFLEILTGMFVGYCLWLVFRP